MTDCFAALVATDTGVYRFDAASGEVRAAQGLDGRPACLAASALRGAADGDVVGWCGTHDAGVFSTRDGVAWTAAGLAERQVTAVAVDPADASIAWAGTEPSAIWRTRGGGTWKRMDGLDELPSSSDWSFPPRPDTHHVRWIACHPGDTDRLWAAIEAGALVSTRDGGRTWEDRVPGGPYDTHELAVDPSAPHRLHVAAGDGYYESDDGGATWTSPSEGLEVGYLVSVALQPADPPVVIVSAASHPHAAYRAGRSDGRLYRRTGPGPWELVTDGWPEPPDTVAPIVRPTPGGGFLAVDERGLHLSDDGGRAWSRVAGFADAVSRVRGMAVLPTRDSSGG